MLPTSSLLSSRGVKAQNAGNKRVNAMLNSNKYEEENKEEAIIKLPVEPSPRQKYLKTNSVVNETAA